LISSSGSASPCSRAWIRSSLNATNRSISDTVTVFVFRVTYIASREAVAALVPDHIAWLESHHATGRFVVSGQTVPEAAGGVIVVRGDVRAEAEALAASDPFVRGGVARTEVIEFTPARKEPGFAARCACGHDAIRVPESRAEAMELARRRRDPAFERVAVDNAKWMSVYRCPVCGGHWAEDGLMSGQMDLFYLYPIETEDPAAWLASAKPLDV
jgi:uncharacterized protein YciI